MNKQKQIRKNESGFAAILIAMSLILILSLITVGFATLMRKEQRSALDKHLSRQAYYAAESGVNDAEKAIKAGYTSAKTTCGPLAATDTSPGASFLRGNSSSSVGESTDGLSYTCLLINPTPSDIEYIISPEDTKVTQLTGVNSAGVVTPISRLDITWEASGSSAPSQFRSATSRAFPAITSWNSATGVLRASFMPISTACMDRNTMINCMYTNFLYPNASGGGSNVYNASLTPESKGKIVSGDCASANTLDCRVSIRSITPSIDYMLVLKSIYQTSHVRVEAYDAANTRLLIRNAQTVVDSTGKAQDVLRRIQVRVPTTSSYDMPDSALDVMAGICKQLEVEPSSERNACTP